VQHRRAPGQRAGLSRPQVLAAARRLLAEEGLDALTMRGLAQRLDVSPNALYSHVANKTALIDDVLDDVLAEVEAPGPEAGDPAAGLHDLMASTYRVLLAHADLVPLYLARQGARGPNAQHLGDIVLALLARADVTGPRAREALRVLIVYTIGFAAFTARGPLMPGDEPEPPTIELAENFDRGLRWLLTGIGAGGGQLSSST
jgi:AcrR family transcriptional regulator